MLPNWLKLSLLMEDDSNALASQILDSIDEDFEEFEQEVSKESYDEGVLEQEVSKERDEEDGLDAVCESSEYCSGSNEAIDLTYICPTPVQGIRRLGCVPSKNGDGDGDGDGNENQEDSPPDDQGNETTVATTNSTTTASPTVAEIPPHTHAPSLDLDSLGSGERHNHVKDILTHISKLNLEQEGPTTTNIIISIPGQNLKEYKDNSRIGDKFLQLIRSTKHDTAMTGHHSMVVPVKTDSFHYAVKVSLSQSAAEEGSDDDSTKQELKVLSTLNHNNIVRFFGAIRFTSTENARGHWLQILAHEGRDLFNLINEDVHIVFAYRISITRQLAEAINYMHDNNLLHCDIKPENCLVKVTARRVHLRVADFELSTSITLARDQRIAELGSMMFKAPEIRDVNGKDGYVTCASDVYAAAITCMHLLKSFIFNTVTDSNLTLMIENNKWLPSRATLKCRENSFQEYVEFLVAFNPKLVSRFFSLLLDLGQAHKHLSDEANALTFDEMKNLFIKNQHHQEVELFITVLVIQMTRENHLQRVTLGYIIDIIKALEQWQQQQQQQRQRQRQQKQEQKQKQSRRNTW
ncbi:hypothetical protein ACH42_04515 [Endozoicomonas sp. (ex Bugula neritina AB1)]|nr:hypothetical protein ACH42_04515 [Endozoicomonas sp. (ex Bugula neritina AB1)]